MRLPDSPIPWWHPVLGKREKQLVSDVMESNFINDGEYTTQFEGNIADLCDVPYAVAVTSGTAALFLGLKALGVGEGDEVLVPDFTFIASANAISMTGACPVFVDVDIETFNIDPNKIEKKITDKTKVIMPVHISGRGANMTALMDIANRHNLFVLEDAAEALGSELNGRPLGTIGDVGCFSFSPNKTVTTGQGGMIVTKDTDIHQRLRELKDQGRPVRGTGGDDEHISIGYNFKLTNLQAAIGMAQMESFEVRKIYLQNIFRKYREELFDIPELRFPGFDIDKGECPQWVDVWVEDRESLYEYLLVRNVGTRKFWFPLHTQAPYRNEINDYPGSDAVSAHGLWLSSALSLSMDDIENVCGFIREWSQKRNSK